MSNHNSIEIPSLDELAEQKNALMGKMFEASSALKAAARDVASQESKIAAYLIGIGKPNEAVLNLISEASLLVNADEYLEAISVYKHARSINKKQRVSQYIDATIAQLETVVGSFKVQKSLKDVIDLVDRMGGSMISSGDGPGARFADFSFQGEEFHVDISTTFKLTTDANADGFEVTSLERLEERIKDAAVKSAISDRTAAEGYDDGDDDE